MQVWINRLTARCSAWCDGSTKSLGSSVLLSFYIFAFLLIVFAASPIKLPTDSRWSVHTAMSFVRGHGGDLTEFLPIVEKEKFYAIEYPDGRPRTRYPIGTSLLAAPAVGLVGILRPDWAIDLSNAIPVRTEQFIASLIGAATGVVFFWVIFLQFQSAQIALISTVILAFGTSIWSTSTRALWQHGPLVLMFTVAMLLLARARQRPALVQFVSIPLMFGYVVRPTGVVALAILSLYVLVYHRQWVLKYISWSLLIAVPWIAYNLAIYGKLLPAYYVGEAFSAQTHFAEGLLGNFFSPSRGLFVFSPVLLFALSGFAIALRNPDQRPLNIAYASIVLGQSIIVGAASMWWAGHAYGPRFMTDVVPFLVYFTAFNFRLPDTVSQGWRRAVSVAVIALAVVSAAIHAQGAFRYGTWQWNYMPDNIDAHPSRAWDWSDAQFARTHR